MQIFGRQVREIAVPIIIMICGDWQVMIFTCCGTIRLSTILLFLFILLVFLYVWHSTEYLFTSIKVHMCSISLLQCCLILKRIQIYLATSLNARKAHALLILFAEQTLDKQLLNKWLFFQWTAHGRLNKQESRGHCEKRDSYLISSSSLWSLNVNCFPSYFQVYLL